MKDDIKDAWMEWNTKSPMFKMVTGGCLMFLIVALAICVGGNPANG